MTQMHTSTHLDTFMSCFFFNAMCILQYIFMFMKAEDRNVKHRTVQPILQLPRRSSEVNWTPPEALEATEFYSVQLEWAPRGDFFSPPGGVGRK